jgi:hypothetical protein
MRISLDGKLEKTNDDILGVWGDEVKLGGSAFMSLEQCLS